MTANYDAILIGSGIGALTVAVGLARQKRFPEEAEPLRRYFCDVPRRNRDDFGTVLRNRALNPAPRHARRGPRSIALSALDFRRLRCPKLIRRAVLFRLSFLLETQLTD